MIDSRTIRDTELDKVLDIIRRFALSPEGRDGIVPERITSDREEIERRAERVARYMSLLGGSAPEPFPSISDLFVYAEHTHADFPGEAIHRAGEFLRSYKAMLDFEDSGEALPDEDEALSSS